MKLVESSGVGDIGKDDRRALDKPASSDGTVQGIFDRSVREPGAHSALLTVSVGFRLVLGQSSGKQ